MKEVYGDGERFRKHSSRAVALENKFALLDEADMALMREIMAFEEAFLSRKNGADHVRVRSAVARWFTPKRIAELQARVRELVDELLDALADDRVVDLARFAYELPLLVVMELLGAPREDAGRLKEWGDAVQRPQARTPLHPKDVHEAHAALAEYRAYSQALVERHRSEAERGELVEGLLTAAEGERLTEDELVAFFLHTMFAGHETTANLITNGLVALLTNRGEWERLCADPTLADTAVEELLRYEPAVQFGVRLAACDLELDGVGVAAGSAMLVMIAAANRDPAVFAEPDRLDMSRRPTTTWRSRSDRTSASARRWLGWRGGWRSAASWSGTRARPGRPRGGARAQPARRTSRLPPAAGPARLGRVGARRLDQQARERAEEQRPARCGGAAVETAAAARSAAQACAAVTRGHARKALQPAQHDVLLELEVIAGGGELEVGEAPRRACRTRSRPPCAPRSRRCRSGRRSRTTSGRSGGGRRPGRRGRRTHAGRGSRRRSRPSRTCPGAAVASPSCCSSSVPLMKNWTGESWRSTSSTVVPRSDGSSRRRSHWSRCCSSANSPLPNMFAVVSCPAKSRRTYIATSSSSSIWSVPDASSSAPTSRRGVGVATVRRRELADVVAVGARALVGRPHGLRPRRRSCRRERSSRRPTP